MSYVVTELSERGMRIRADQIPAADGITRGCLHLGDGQCVAVEGRLARRDGPELIISGLTGIHYFHIISEQRRILKDYPSLIGD